MVQVSGASSMAARTDPVPIWPPLRTTVWITSRKVNMPTRSPRSMTTSEPMSFSAITAAACARRSSGLTV